MFLLIRGSLEHPDDDVVSGACVSGDYLVGISDALECSGLRYCELGLEVSDTSMEWSISIPGVTHAEVGRRII